MTARADERAPDLSSLDHRHQRQRRPGHVVVLIGDVHILSICLGVLRGVGQRFGPQQPQGARRIPCIIRGRADADARGLQVVGIILAVISGLLIGSSFVFKKKGLLRSQAGQVAGEGVAYLKSVCAGVFPLEYILIGRSHYGG